MSGGRSLRLALSDILESIAEIEDFTADAGPGLSRISKRDYHAALFSLLKLTEATRQIPDDLEARRPDLPWADIGRTGNVIRHNYFRIKPSVIADIVQNDLPALKAAAAQFWRDADFGDPPVFG